MPISIHELYQQPEVQAYYEERWIDHLPLDAMLAVADEALGRDDPVAYLDELSKKDSKQWLDARFAISRLSPESILNNYGVEMLAWAALNASFDYVSTEMKLGLQERTNIDPDMLEKARLWTWQKHRSSKSKEILHQYSVMNELLHGGLDTIDLDTILVNSSQAGTQLSEKRLHDYSLLPLRAEQNYAYADGVVKGWYGETEPGIIHEIWLDAPVGFALAYKDRPNAVVGLAATGQHELMIYQLQGVRATRIDLQNGSDEITERHVAARGLAPLDWQKTMIDIVKAFAAQMGMTSIAVQGGRNNTWANTKVLGKTEPHLSLEAAIKAYDVPAERLGFTQDEAGNWHRPAAANFKT